MALRREAPAAPPPPGAAARQGPVLRLEHVSKSFGAQRALADVSFELAPGEVHALVGQNGSGKSTLVKILAGYHMPDPGALTWWDGEAVDPHRIGSWHRGEIGFVHQDLGLIGMLSAAENLAIGRGFDTTRLGNIAWRRQYSDAAARIRRLGGRFDVRTPVARLEAGERTVVAMARALGNADQTRVLVLDEPTAALPLPEVERLLDAVRRAAAHGTGVIYVSHRLDEVLALADRISVLRDGRMVATYQSAEFDVSTLVEKITGHPAGPGAARPGRKAGRPAMLSAANIAAGRLRELDVAVAAGEIVGITGILGSGREEVAGALFGSAGRLTGTVTVNGHNVPPGSPFAAIAAGLGLVPADRARFGLILEHSLRENVSLSSLPSLTNVWGVSKRRERSAVADLLTQLSVRPPAPERRAATLSGGNQQKVLLAKWLATKPQALILDEPGQGIDIGAKAAIYRTLRGLADDGMALLVISAETEDLPVICDRVLVLRHGMVAAELAGDTLTEANIVHESLAP
jgi:ribose transport system ATP-binding protein